MFEYYDFDFSFTPYLYSHSQARLEEFKKQIMEIPELIFRNEIPCGSTEIRTTKDGVTDFKLERTTGCECMYCMLNSGDWVSSKKHIRLVGNMMGHGWGGPNSGQPFGEFLKKVEEAQAVTDQEFLKELCNMKEKTTIQPQESNVPLLVHNHVVATIEHTDAKFVEPSSDDHRVSEYVDSNSEFHSLPTIKLTINGRYIFISEKQARELAEKLVAAADDAEEWRVNDDRAVLARYGWKIVSQEPFGIRHTDGSVASNKAAQIILEKARDEDL